MKVITTSVPGSKAYLLPIGDVHWGSHDCTDANKEKLKGYLEWARERADQCRIVLMGDLIDCATRGSKTSPFGSESSEYVEVMDLFEPFRDLIITSIPGNHDLRLANEAGLNYNTLLCRALGVPDPGFSCIVHYRVGVKEDKRASASKVHRETYRFYCHHSRGGGGTIGNALNRAVKLAGIVEGMDGYLIGHNHQAVSASDAILGPGGVSRRRTFVCCGSYTSWEGSYAEEFGFGMGRVGSPRIRLSGKQHDLHVSW